jgi:hypothetical protein
MKQIGSASPGPNSEEVEHGTVEYRYSPPLPGGTPEGDGTFPTIKQVRIMLSQRSNWAEVSTAVAMVRKEFRAIT